jgi:hypothetical protein
MALSNQRDLMEFWSPASHLTQLCRSLWDGLRALRLILGFRHSVIGRNLSTPTSQFNIKFKQRFLCLKSSSGTNDKMDWNF